MKALKWALKKNCVKILGHEKAEKKKEKESKGGRNGENLE